MAMLMIREYRREDLKGVTDIINWYIANSSANFEYTEIDTAEMGRRVEEILAGGYPFYVYESDGVVAGYCYAHQWKGRAAYHLTVESTIYLHPDHLGRGVGRRMMERLISDCRALGYEAMIADITVGNTSSEHLHERLGFRKVSHFERVGHKFGNFYDVADYELLLQKKI